MVKRPWLLFSWLALAALVVGAQHWVPQPWTAAAYPIALIVALWLFKRATPRN
jgi:membrane protein implicated in regulation of membrane protease activity